MPVKANDFLGFTLANAGMLVIGQIAEIRTVNPDREGSRQITPFVSEFPHHEFKLPLIRAAALDPYPQCVRKATTPKSV